MSKLPKPWIPINDEKVPDTTIEVVIVGSVTLKSRYKKRNEFFMLAALAFALDDDMREAIVSILCDSKVGSHYVVTMIDGLDQSEITQPIAQRLHDALWQAEGGHNGIYVGQTGSIDPDWTGDDDA